MEEPTNESEANDPGPEPVPEQSTLFTGHKQVTFFVTCSLCGALVDGESSVAQSQHDAFHS